MAQAFIPRHHDLRDDFLEFVTGEVAAGEFLLCVLLSGFMMGKTSGKVNESQLYLIYYQLFGRVAVIYQIGRCS